MKQPKILIYDIETSPVTGYAWGMFCDRLIKVTNDWQLMSVAWKWDGSKTEVVSQRDLEESELVAKVWELFDEADIIVTHNGDKFDNKKVQAKFIEYGFPPPTPYQSVDTYKVAKRYFNFTSNRLDAIAQLLGVGKKLSTGGFELWEGCMAGDERAWGKMERYNKRDVDILHKVYLKLRPYHRSHPNMALLAQKPHSCKVCNHTGLKAHGWHYTRTQAYRVFICKKCGHPNQSARVDKSIIKAEVK